MAKEKVNLYLLAIVAIVAVVGIVVLVLNANTGGEVAVVDEDGNVVGMAISSRMNQWISTPDALRSDVDAFIESNTGTASVGGESARGCKDEDKSDCHQLCCGYDWSACNKGCQ